MCIFLDCHNDLSSMRETGYFRAIWGVPLKCLFLSTHVKGSSDGVILHIASAKYGLHSPLQPPRAGKAKTSWLR